MVCREGLETLVVFPLGEGVVHGLYKTVGCQEVGYGTAYSLRLRLRRRIDRHLHMLRKSYVVVTVDAQDFLHHVAFAGDVHHVARRQDSTFRTFLGFEGIGKAFEYSVYVLVSQLLPDEGLNAVVVQFDSLALNLLRIALDYFPYHASACIFADQRGCALEGVDGYLRVSSALVAEGSVGLELLALAGLAYAARIEVSAFDEKVHGAVAHSAVLASEDAGYAHRALSVSDYHIGGVQLVLRSVQGTDRLAFGSAADYHLAASHLVCIKGVQRLAEFEEHVVGDVDYVVNRAAAHCAKPFLHPFRRRADLYALEKDARVARSSTRIKHLNRHCLALCARDGVEACFHIRTGEFTRNAVVPEVGVKIAGHSPMGSRIHAVGRNLIFNHRKALDV